MAQTGDPEVGWRDADQHAAASRFNARHAVLVDGFRHVIADSTVLLLGAGNGQWCYAYAAAGALNVIGVEPDAALVEGFSQLPDIGLRERIEMRCGDPVTELREEARCNRLQDIVVVMDCLEGQPDLPDVFRNIVALSPRLVIVDGRFANTQEPVLLLHPLTYVQDRPPLVPSLGALFHVAEDSGFDVAALDWARFEKEDRIGLEDYYAPGRIIRASFAITPVDG